MTAAMIQAVVIGASAGAIQALLHILPQLPADFALPLLVVVHLPPGRRSELTTLFQSRCALPVHEADDKEVIVPGTVYFAPPNYHMLAENGGTISLSTDEPVCFSRPSIDVLFETAADAWGPGTAAIVLTGANEDGARGLAAIGAAGGTALVQDPADAYVPVMPAAALARWPDAKVLSLDGIVAYLKEVGAK